jgi:hypothetical protein
VAVGLGVGTLATLDGLKVMRDAMGLSGCAEAAVMPVDLEEIPLELAAGCDEVAVWF